MMREGTSRLRLRGVLASWFTVLVVVMLATAALGGWATYNAHIAPGTVQETRQEAVWSVNGSFEHAARVTEENPVFQTGTTLTNRSTYFTTATPVLDGAFNAAYRGAANGPVTLHLESDLVHRSVKEETVYWSTSRDIGSTTATVTPDGTVTLPFSFNASREIAHRENISSALGGTPGEPETFVAVAVTATSESAPPELTYTATLPVTFEAGTYSVGDPSGTSEQVMQATTTTVPREYGPVARFGGPVGLFFGLGGLLALGMLRYREEPLELTAEERSILAYRTQRSEFDEWVVRAELPDGILDRETASADSFADIVDFAIDSDVAVIEEPSREQYYAVTSDLLVTFIPPEAIERIKGGVSPDEHGRGLRQPIE